MVKIEVLYSAEFGIMFLHDAKSAPNIPQGAGLEPIMHTPDCVAFCVINYVDGDAKVVIAGDEYNSTYQERFSGKIACNSRALALTDPNGFMYASVPLADTFAILSLRMSNDRNSDVVECIVHNMLTF